MAKVKYYAKENSTIGTHSFYAVPIPNGTLTFDELLEEAMDGKSVEPSIAKACVTEFMKAVKRNVLKGFRCQLGDNFLTVYPNIQLSVKDTEDPETHEPIVATAEMLNAANGKSRLGCTVAAKFSRQFSDEVRLTRRLLPLHLARRTSPRVATTRAEISRVATWSHKRIRQRRPSGRPYKYLK